MFTRGAFRFFCGNACAFDFSFRSPTSFFFCASGVLFGSLTLLLLERVLLGESSSLFFCTLSFQLKVRQPSLFFNASLLFLGALNFESFLFSEQTRFILSFLARRFEFGHERVLFGDAPRFFFIPRRIFRSLTSNFSTRELLGFIIHRRWRGEFWFVFGAFVFGFQIRVKQESVRIDIGDGRRGLQGRSTEEFSPCSGDLRVVL
mmetsp:Transcript_3869/g.13008  ORF Transcript_3869/g.13008 Transcript_3869/m.13008 type:complete len:204 (+) Transcript_3869:1635-2246(+)